MIDVAKSQSTFRYYPLLLTAITLSLAAAVLITNNLWNPWPQVTGWWGRVTALATPAPAWETRADGVPDLAAVLPGGQVIVASRGFVAAHAAATGQVLWRADVYWALPAQDVVVARQRSTNPDSDPQRGRGYAVLDPATGAALWSDHDAKAVWAFADLILDLACPESGPCVLRARRHRDGGAAVWTVAMPNDARTVLGADPPLAGTEDPATWFATARAGTPGRTPAVIGITIADHVEVIDTVDGRLLREAAATDRTVRVAIAADRILLSTAAPGGATCRFSLDAMNVRTGQIQWHADGLDLRNSSGAGCEQRRDPSGAGSHIIATNGENAPVLIEAGTGRTVWRGVPGDRVLATDGQVAVVQSADRKTVRVLDLLAEGTPAAWSGALGLSVDAVVGAGEVIIHDGDKGRVIVLGHRPVALRSEVSTRATVIGFGGPGLLLASGRRMGFIPLAG